MNVSVVVPMLNESGNVGRLLREVPTSLEANPYVRAWEIVCVDDGSTDDTGRLLREHRTPETTLLGFTENRGKSAALSAGFQAARYDVVVVFDGDLQADPDDLRPLLNAIAGGADGAVGVRTERVDGLGRKLSSAVARWVRHAALRDGFHDITCPIQAYRAECVDRIDPFPAFHRFIPHLVQLHGYRVEERPVRHLPRTAGASKYGVRNRLGIGVRSLLRVRKLTRAARNPR